MNSDLRPVPEPVGAFQRWLAARLLEPRDLPLARVLVQCAAFQLVGVAIFFLGPAAWMVAPLYWAAWGFGFLDRFILLLHCTSHRSLFRDRRLNRVIPWVVGPFFGQTPESYYAHHMGMHHPENNLADDLSTTVRYQRDSFRAWLHYLGSFLVTGLPALARYHRARGNRKLFRRLLLGEGTFWLTSGLLLWLNWQATLIVLVIPVVAVRALMMAGNWGQHAFVDPSDPGNAYRNSITCINTRYNRRCFNDGYHILHHIRPRTHFSEYPEEFERNRAEYGRHDAIVFDGVDFFQVWLYLVLGKHHWLARRMVRLPGAANRTDAEAVAFMRTRLAPIDIDAVGLAAK